MAGIVTNIIQNSLSGFVNGAVSTAGGYAGSAVNGLGGLIESAGDSVGNGRIAKSFEGVGNGISAYGASVINATAPNAGGGMKRIDPKSKPGVSKVGTQKALPSTAAHTQRALPSTKPMKALPAPPAKKDTPAAKKELPKVKPPYQPPSSTFSSSKPGAYQPPKSTVGVGKKKDEATGVKSRALSSGKIVASRDSLPQHMRGGVTPGSARPPSFAKAPSLNLPPSAGSSKPYTPNAGFKAPPSKAGSVAGGGQKSFGGHIPGFAPSKPGSNAPSAAGVGSKSPAKPPPSKAGSVVGGPKFF